jgi:S-adenosyl methyltransferase
VAGPPPRDASEARAGGGMLIPCRIRAHIYGVRHLAQIRSNRCDLPAPGGWRAQEEIMVASKRETPADGIDTSVPNSARVWNYWLGGKDNYRLDRSAGDRFRQIYPDIDLVARSVRGFLTRVVQHVAAEAGIRQFLDIGTGLPAVAATHEVAQAVDPRSRIVYVDNDPLVLVHARALLTSDPRGVCSYVQADVREPDLILECAAETLDFSEPVAVLMLGILGHVSDAEDPGLIVQRLAQALPSGSYLAISDGTNTNADRVAAHDQYRATGAVPYWLRSPAQISLYFDGLQLAGPGVVPVSQWRQPSPEKHVDTIGGLALKL